MITMTDAAIAKVAEYMTDAENLASTRHAEPSPRRCRSFLS